MSKLRQYLRRHHDPVQWACAIILLGWFVIAEIAMFQQWVLHR